MEQVGHFFAFFVVSLNVAHGIFLFHFFFSLVAANSQKYTLQLQIREGRKEEGKLFIYFA